MSEFAAMLAQDVDGNEVSRIYFDASNWWMSQKLDGLRMQAIVKDGIVLLNREGKPFSKPVPPGVIADLKRLAPIWWFDGELVGDTYWIFDCIASSEFDISPDSAFDERYDILTALFVMWQPKNIKLLTQHIAADDQRVVYSWLENEHAEGVIFRNSLSRYVFGLRSLDLMVKVKFWKTVDVILYNIGREGKRSAGMAVVEDGQLRDVGSVKLTDGMLATLEKGTVAEVKCLYATEEGKLYQPSILRLRDDKQPLDCTFDQVQRITTNKQVVEL